MHLSIWTASGSRRHFFSPAVAGDTILHLLTGLLLLVALFSSWSIRKYNLKVQKKKWSNHFDFLSVFWQLLNHSHMSGHLVLLRITNKLNVHFCFAVRMIWVIVHYKPPVHSNVFQTLIAFLLLYISKTAAADFSNALFFKTNALQAPLAFLAFVQGILWYTISNLFWNQMFKNLAFQSNIP